jgi:membrane protease YdiL (CAAX protease family)
VLTLAVAVIARFAERLGLADVGFGRVSWLTPLGALALAAFFIALFGPAVYWVLAHLPLGSFAAGVQRLNALPRWFLALDVVIVAAAEEWLYRGYAIGRLEALTGRAWLAGLISLAVFGLAHLALWSPGAALSTLVSGAFITAIYLWRRDIVLLIGAHVITDLFGLVIAPALR